jgi:hypothetical protein
MLNVKMPWTRRDHTLDALPLAQSIIAQLRQELEDAGALGRAALHKLMDLREEHARQKTLLREMIDPPLGGGYRRYPEDHPTVVGLKMTVADLETEVAQAVKLHDERVADIQAVGPILNRLEHYLQKVLSSRSPLLPHTGRLSRSARGNPLREIQEQRTKIETLTNEYDRVAAAPLPAGEVKKRLRDQISKIASTGAPDVLAFIDRRSPDLEFPKANIMVSSPTAVLGTSIPDALAFVVWLNQDLILAHLDKEIDTATNSETAMTDAARVRRLSELSHEILEAERVEEAAIREAHDAGHKLPRRDDADPRAILHLSGEMPPPERI